MITHDIDTVLLLDCNVDREDRESLVKTVESLKLRAMKKLEAVVQAEPTLPGDLTSDIADFLVKSSSEHNGIQIKSLFQALKKQNTPVEYRTIPVNHTPIRIQPVQAGYYSPRRRSSSYNTIKGLNFIPKPTLLGHSPMSHCDYKSVVVLPISWEPSPRSSPKEKEDIKQFNGELEKLVQVFRDRLHFSIKTMYKLPQDSVSQETCAEAILTHVNELGKDDLFIVIYNGHGKNDRLYPGNLLWSLVLSPKLMPLTDANHLSRPTLDSYTYFNWTKVVQRLNVEECDVLQVLDCCYAGTGTKGEAERQMLRYPCMETDQDQFRGRNEILASCGRDDSAPSGTFASMRIFASELESLARQNNCFSVDHWYHAIDSHVHVSMVKARKDRSEADAPRWHATPYRKMNPIIEAQNSIRLRRRTS